MEAPTTPGKIEAKSNLPPSGDDLNALSSSNVSPSRVQKRQPWRAVWPRTGPLEGQVMRYYGFKKGEKMSVPGNAGDFFAHGNWTVEFETT